MKLSFLSLLSLLSSAATTLAAPTDTATGVTADNANDGPPSWRRDIEAASGVTADNANDGPPSWRRDIDARSLHDPASNPTRRQNGNPNTEATLQAWRFDPNCAPGPGFNFLWFPVSWTSANAPNGACHEFWEGGQRRDILSVMATGGWRGTCRLRMYQNPGCTGSFALQTPGVCGNRGGAPIASFNVVC
ncbi:uncharacterized protein B0T15DRAFT_185115 [Chaetomium strumarium]|uniref:Uncharacterized protein n=1 Tax=Chaetomium strumarium TaxID=1170767 RepID=A0AAJ0GWY9_9PEZI|nr:hypothetical protein B0T15DRAFT_185115 [Chaetomium strumarium]